MLKKTAIVIGSLVVTLIVALVAGTSSTSAQVTKNLRFEGSGTDRPIDIKFHCDPCVPDAFVSGVGQAAFTIHVNTKADLVGNASLTIDLPEGLLNQGSTIPVPVHLQGVDAAGKEFKISADIKGRVSVQENVPSGGGQGSEIFGFGLTSPSFTLVEADLAPLHNGQQASVTGDLKSPTLIDPCELAGLSFTIDKGIGDVGIGLRCPITLVLRTTADLTGNGITARRTVEVKGGPSVSAGTIDFPKGPVTDLFEIPCDAPASSFINYGLTDKRYGVNVDSTAKLLLQARLQAGIDTPIGFFDLLEFLGIDASVRININDLLGLPHFDVFDGKVVASYVGAPKPTNSLGQVSKDKVQPRILGVLADPLIRPEGKEIRLEALATDNCNSPLELQYHWTFSDGGTAFGHVTFHVFPDNGNHSLKLVVTDKAGNQAARDFPIPVSNQPPIITPLPETVKAPWGKPITFSCNAVDSSPVDNAKLKYLWTFGDGGSSGNPKVEHTYANPGTYTATCTVSDDKESSTATTLVTINKRATNIKYNGPIKRDPADRGPKIELSAGLIDHNGEPVKGRELQFCILAGEGTVPTCARNLTDGNGAARVSLVPPELPGTYIVQVTFAGDTLYEPAEFTKTYIVHNHETEIKNCGPVQVSKFANKVALCARLLDLGGGVKGKTIQFDLAAKHIAGVTDANGEARVSLAINLKEGCYPFQIAFKGDALYKPSKFGPIVFTVGEPRQGQCQLDNDGDGCANVQELGTNVVLGGLRDPDNPYDFFDTPLPAGAPGTGRRDRVISAGDLFGVILKFGTYDGGPATGQGQVYNAAFDRTPLGPEPWHLGTPDGRVTTQDIFLAVVQFGHTCIQTP